MIVLAADGTMIYNGEEMLNFNYQTTSPVLDVYATNSMDLGDLPAGQYQFKVVVHDKLRNKDEFRDRRCAKCKWFEICKGNFRFLGSDSRIENWQNEPACYLTDKEIGIADNP